LGVAAELSANLRYIGLGVSVFGALASSHRFAGIGVTAQLGKISIGESMRTHRRFASAAVMLVCARTAVAQAALAQSGPVEWSIPSPTTPAPVAINSADQHVKIWASLSVGTINVKSHEANVPFPHQGGALSLWATRGNLAASIRAAGTNSEVGPGTGDVSVLVGVHAAPVHHVDAVAAIGVGQSTGQRYPTNFATEPVFAASAQANLNFYVVGVGIDTFAAIGSTRRYAGFGLMLDLGWFR
jgi:hypothetical protein